MVAAPLINTTGGKDALSEMMQDGFLQQMQGMYEENQKT